MIRNLLLLFFVTTYVNSISQDTIIFKKTLSEITVKSSVKKESSISVINTVRNNSVISDGVSIEYIRRTPDKNLGDALKRINGVTIQNDKFVLVRGLADRYNSVILNRNVLSSTEPDRRSFSFDIIPTGLIDNVIVAKSASANLPGDFAGGIVQITTKEISNNFFNLGLGLGIGSVSTNRRFKLVEEVNIPLNFPSTYKFRLGSNSEKREWTSLLNDGKNRGFRSYPNLNGSVSIGKKFNKFNVLFSSTARNTFILNYTDRLDYQSSTELAYKYKDTSYYQIQTINGLLNITYLGKNRYSWKTLYNYQNENLYLNRVGENYDNIQNVFANASNHVIKNVINSQFDGKINKTDFNIGYNLMLRKQPDYRINPITKSLGVNEPYAVAWRDTYRFWSDLTEHGFSGNINQSFRNLKVGGGYVKRYRDFRARVFRYTSTTMLDEITNNTDRYAADFDLGSLYTMYDNSFGKWKLNTGLRTEYNLFNVSTSDFSGSKVKVNREYLDFLPSLNLSYNLEKTKWRFSTSKTLARPEFREVANFAYYDFVRNAQLLGNTNLKKTDIYNVDLKWEFYPKSGENISVALFGKNFINPIEQIVADGSVPSNLLLTYMNPKGAKLYGIEFEFRKSLNKWIDVYTNTSIMQSEVKIGNVKRQLQGQSNYVINGGLNLHKGKNTLNFTYNRVGDRISAVGFQGYPDIFENSRDIVDIVYLRKIKIGEIKIGVGDLFAQPSIYYQKVNNRNLIKTNNEQTISLSLNLNL